jgi:hypothetical protein
MLDTEHSPANPRAIEDAVLAADIVGFAPTRALKRKVTTKIKGAEE